MTTPDLEGLRRRHDDQIDALLDRLDERDAAVARLTAAAAERDAYRSAYGCLSCGEVHPEDDMCPPHEVRVTGQAWFYEKISLWRRKVTAAETEIARLTAENAALREVLGAVVALDREAAGPHGLLDCIDNDGDRYQSAHLAQALFQAARLTEPKETA